MTHLKTTTGAKSVDEEPTLESLCYMGLFIHPDDKTIEYCGNSGIFLAQSELKILYHMMRHPDIMHTRTKLMRALGKTIDDRSIDHAVKRIRKKFNDAGAPGGQIIVSQYGIGYRLWRQTDLSK
jgi:DNA-binding response OmpR family regulator